MLITKDHLAAERTKLLEAARQHLAAHHQCVGAIAQLDALAAHLAQPEPTCGQAPAPTAADLPLPP